MSDTEKERKAPTGVIGKKPGKAEYSALDTRWLTPDYILSRVRNYFGGRIPFDIATEPNNPTDAEYFWTEQDDSLSQEIWPSVYFCNPPYGKVLRHWLKAFSDSSGTGSEIIAIIPAARWEQSYFTGPFSEASHVCFIRGRVNFIRAASGEAVNGNPYATLIVGWNTDTKRFCDSFGDLGCCIGVLSLCPGPDKPNRKPICDNEG